MKNIRLYIILLILISIAAIYFFSNTKGTLNLRNAEFAIESVDEISKIQISSQNQQLILEKKYGYWNVNQKYRANQKYVENLLLAMNRVVVLSPVSNVEKEQIAAILKLDGTWVEIYKKNRIIKKYWVSKPGMNPSKTFMMMGKSESPFIVKIPAFNGLLSELYIADENYWRDKTVFDYEPQNIKTITVEYPTLEKESFQLVNYNDGTFSIQNLTTKQFLENFDVSKLARYFTYYQRISFEDIVRDMDQQMQDSVLNSVAFCRITVEDITENVTKISFFRKAPENKFDEFDHSVDYDFNRAYAVLNDNRELIIIQYYIFDPLFKEIDYFR